MWSENKARREVAGNSEGEKGEMESRPTSLLLPLFPEKTKTWRRAPGTVLEPPLTEIPATIPLTFKLGLTAPPNGNTQPSELGDN